MPHVRVRRSVALLVVCATTTLLAGCGSAEARAGVKANIDRLGPEVAEALGTSYSIWATGAAMEGASGTSEVELPYSTEKYEYLAAPGIVAGCLALVERLEGTGVHPFAPVLLYPEPVLVDADACRLGAGQFAGMADFELRPVADDGSSLDVSARLDVQARTISVDERTPQVLPVVELGDHYPRQLLATASPFPFHLPAGAAEGGERMKFHVTVPHGRPVTVVMRCTPGPGPVAAVMQQHWGLFMIETATYFDDDGVVECALQPAEAASYPLMTLYGPDGERLDLHAFFVSDVGAFELTVE